MHHWHERVYWSVSHDAEVSRLSGFDDHAREHWMIVEAGKGYRDRREEALLKIQDAIEAGHEPGEVA
jgi:hypothetical protein